MAPLSVAETWVRLIRHCSALCLDIPWLESRLGQETNSAAYKVLLGAGVEITGLQEMGLFKSLPTPEPWEPGTCSRSPPSPAQGPCPSWQLRPAPKNCGCRYSWALGADSRIRTASHRLQLCACPPSPRLLLLRQGERVTPASLHPSTGLKESPCCDQRQLGRNQLQGAHPSSWQVSDAPGKSQTPPWRIGHPGEGGAAGTCSRNHTAPKSLLRIDISPLPSCRAEQETIPRSSQGSRGIKKSHLPMMVSPPDDDVTLQ